MQWLPVIAGSSTSDTVLQFQNLPSDGTDGNALLNDVTADTLMSTALSLSGSPYIVPTQNTVTLAPVSNTVGEGTQVVGTGSGLGLAINVSDSQIITIGAPADTVLSPF
jgi:hypothetical protein